MLRLALGVIVVLLCGVVVPAAAGDLAPTGTLRAAFLGNNPVQGRVDPRTGTVTGPIADLVRELARRLKVPYRIIPAADARAVIAHIRGGTADIGFLAYEEARAREVDFAGPFALMFNTYLVRASSPLGSVDDVDRDGVTVGAVRGQTQQIYLAAHLARAHMRIFETQPSQADMERLLSTGELDALALNAQRAAEGAAASKNALRALTGSYVAVEQSFVVRKGDTGSAATINALVDELRASGFIKSSLDRARLVGVGVAPGHSR